MALIAKFLKLSERQSDCRGGEWGADFLPHLDKRSPRFFWNPIRENEGGL